MKAGVNMPQSLIFCSYAPGAGKTTCMLEQARQERLAGYRVSFDFVLDSARPLPGHIAASEKPCINADEIVIRHPEISVIDELMMQNCADAKPLYKTIQKLHEQSIAVYSSTNLFHVRSVNTRYREEAGIEAKATILDRMFLSLGKIVFVDIIPDMLAERYKQDSLFPQHASAFRATYKIERLRMCREICMDYLAELKSDQYEIRMQ